ncbi:MAG: hypothetical protein RSB38_08030 [Oscillospiraceae bacterium]
MGRELINRITVKKDGVYISSHSSNDSAPYRSHKIQSLTDAYEQGGQLQLDIEIIRMLSEYAEVKGTHQSVMRYHRLWDNEFHNEYIEKTNRLWDMLTEEDKKSRYSNDPTVKMKNYREMSTIFLEEKYMNIAKALPATI